MIASTHDRQSLTGSETRGTIVGALREAPYWQPPSALRGLYPDQQDDAVTANLNKYHEKSPHGLAPFLPARDFSVLLTR